MPSPLIEHQHELCDLDGNGGIVFGTVDTGYLTTSRPTISGGDLRLADVERPQEDGVMMGRDYRGSKTYTFEMEVITDRLNGLGVTDPHRANLDALDALETMWNLRKWRNNPQAYALLRSCEGGKVSRCYGRPRRWEESAGALTQRGYTPLVADFALTDDQWYSDVEQVMDVGLVPPPEGGLIAPIVAPITTTLSSSSDALAVVGGKRATWPVVEFHGPVINPVLNIGDMTIGLTGTLAYDQYVIVDTRPWSRSVLRYPGGAGVAGWLTSATPVMRNLMLEAGTHEVTYSGKDLTGTSYARLRWRDARSRP